MKKLRVLFAISLVFPIVLVAANFAQSAYNGKNGKNGQRGENGENGEDGGFFGGNGGNGGNGGSKKKLVIELGQVDEYEYKALKNACRTAITKIEDHLKESGNLNFVIAEQILRSELSNYLLSLETPASKKIQAEYEAIGWKYPDIKAI